MGNRVTMFRTVWIAPIAVLAALFGFPRTAFTQSAPLLPGFANSSTTGYRNAPGFPGALTDFTGSLQSHQVYKFVNFPDGLLIPIGVINVVFFGCRFASNAITDAAVAIYGDDITFAYSSFEPSQAAAPPVPYEKGYQYAIDQRSESRLMIENSDFWGWGNAVQIGYSSKEKPLVIRNSYFHDARLDGGVDHTDAILENYGGLSSMVFDRNTIVSKGNTNGLALQNGNGKGYRNVAVTNNYFSGFGYTVNLCGTFNGCSSVVFTDNTFGTDIKPLWGALYGWRDGDGNLWRRNRWRVVPGGFDVNASNDGKFWLPTGRLSTADYTK